jgi:SAM-dependent methyltransferase
MTFPAEAQHSSNYRKHTTGNRLQRALIVRFQRKIVREIVSLAPMSFLDAGCGEGFVARRLLKAMPDLALTGCDVSTNALSIAASANPTATFLPASVVELPFPDDAFDVVGCFEVLEHLPGDMPRQALAELRRVARRAVVLSVPREPLFCLANAARGKNLAIRPPGSDPDHKQFWTKQAFARVVSEQMRLRTLDSSFPWTICVAEVPARRVHSDAVPPGDMADPLRSEQ